MTIRVKNPTTGVVNAVTSTQTTTLQNDLQIPTLINQNSLTLSISLQAQVQALSQAVTALSVATISPSRVGPFVDAGITYADAATYLAALSVKINSSGGTPGSPVKNAAPTVAFPGGTGDVNETPTYTWGTYTGTAVTSRDVQVLVNGIVVATIIGITNGAVLPVIPTAAGTGARSYAVNEIAHWAGETAPVLSSSIVYTINAVGAPVNTAQPLVTPAAGTDLTTLTATRGVYTVGGLTVNNSTLSFTQRWATDWTLTAALTTATSATLNAPWLGPTGTYNVHFSDGSVKSTALTNSSASFSWLGAVTATTLVRVDLTTATSVLLGTNSIGHIVRYYEIATGTGGAAVEVQGANNVTATSSSSGGGGGVVEAGHSWLVSVPANGAKSWADYQTKRALWPSISGRTSQNAEAWVASIPTSGGVTLPLGSTAAQINATLTTNTIVFLAQGTYNIDAMIKIPVNTWLIGLGTGAFFDCSNFSVGPYIGVQLLSGSAMVRCTVYRARDFGVWNYGAIGWRFYKVSVQQAGFGGSAIGVLCDKAYDGIAVSSEVLNTIGGGDSDGWDIGRGGGNNTLVDCWAIGNDDDGIDTWAGVESNFIHYGGCSYSGLNIVPGAISGDGNGYKLGGPLNSTPIHYLNQVDASNNKKYGFNYNGTLPGNRHTLYACTGSNNGAGPYAFNGATPDPLQYTIITASAPPPSNIVFSSTSPARLITSGVSNTESGTTVAFSPPANSWLYCTFMGNPSGGGGTPTWNTPTNTGTALAWTKINEVNNASGGGIVVWRAFNSAAQTNITVTCSDSWAVVSAFGFAGMWVDVWTGANASQGTAATGPATKTYTTQTFNLGVTTTAANSIVVLAGLDWLAGGTPTSSDTIDAYTVFQNTSGGRAYKTATSAGAATVNMVMGTSASTSSFVAYEILA